MEVDYESRECETSMKLISVRDEYDEEGSLTLWSGAFCSVHEGWAEPTEEGYFVTTYNGNTFDVVTEHRGDENYETVDRLLGEGWNRVAV